MLRRHSNPTKNKVWWPRQTKLLIGFGLRFFYGFFWVLMSFYRFWTVFYGLWRSCFIKNLVLLTKTCFFSQKLAQNQVLIPRHAFFRDLVDVGYMMMISNCGKYLSQPSLGTKISFIYLKSIYIYRIQKFWGHMLRHSNPTKNKVWWPRQTKLLVGFGLRFFKGFYGCWWVFTGFGRFSTGCGEAASSKTWFCWLKPVFFAETSSKPGFDTSTRFFQGFGWCRIYDDDIKLW